MIRDAVKKLREIPGIVLRSTAIVGFPGETEEDFEELCKFIKEAKFERFGAFTYSREEDTPAYDFPNQVDEQVKQDRYDILMQTQLEISEKFNEKRIGKTYKVMCEGYDPGAGSHYGRSYAEAADIDGATRAQKMWHITIKSIKPTIILMFIFQVGGILNANFDQIMMLTKQMGNSMLKEYADVLDTFIYRLGVSQGRFSFAAAAGLFKSIVNFALLLGSNYVAGKFGEAQLF